MARRATLRIPPTRCRYRASRPGLCPAVEGELHVPGAGSLHARGRDLLGEVGRGDDRLGQAHVVVGQADDDAVTRQEAGEVAVFDREEVDAGAGIDSNGLFSVDLGPLGRRGMPLSWGRTEGVLGSRTFGAEETLREILALDNKDATVLQSVANFGVSNRVGMA
jgi:hypothetical protein